MRTQSFPKLFMYIVLCCAVLVTFSFMTGCKGSDGAAGASAPTTGTVSGTVVTKVGNVALAGVSVTSNPTVTGGSATTAADGSYSLSLPGGYYTLTFSKTNYTTATANVNVANGVQTPSNATMAEAASGAPSVTVTASANDVGYGQPFSVTANATSPLGLSLSYTWTGATGSGNTATATSQTFASALGGTTNQNDVPAFKQDSRFGILPINADTRGTKTVSVTVSDGQGGSTSASVTVNSAAPQSGVRQVATGIPVFLNSGVNNDTTTVWNPVSFGTTTIALSTAGTGTRNPWFVPTAEGAYVVSTSTGSNITIYAGNFVGAITGGADVTKTITSTQKNLWSSMWLGTVPTGVSSVTYTNWPTVTANSNCSGCHKINGGGLAPDVFTPWSQTVHATFFARGLEGITSNSGSCVACHTAGADGVNAGNGGYDDAVAATGFVYQKGMGAWTALTQSYPSVAKMASIQCENCHGAQSTLADPDSGHQSTAVAGEFSMSAARVSFSSDICGQCHASGTGHHNYSEWVNSIDPDTGAGHSNKSVAISHPNCACHSAQAFVQWIDQMNTTGKVQRNFPNVTAAVAEPQTCTACHDPHSDANPNQLRVYDSTPNLVAGFKVEGFGKGAICVVCHNVRDGQQCLSTPTATGYCANASDTATFLHEDGYEGMVYASKAVSSDITGTYTTSASSPHDNPAGSVFAGRNAYFMGNSLPMMSKHANVEDTCAGCHMDLNPQTHVSHGASAVNTHVWYIRDQDRATVCANCHGSVDGEALVTSIENLLSELRDAEANYILTRINSYGPAYYYDSTTSSYIAFTTATSVVPALSHGNPSGTSFIVTDSTGTHSVSSTSVYNSDGSQLFFGNSTNMAGKLFKAGWNYSLIDTDESKGIHNPTFATQSLMNAIQAMQDTTK